MSCEIRIKTKDEVLIDACLGDIKEALMKGVPFDAIFKEIERSLVQAQHKVDESLYRKLFISSLKMMTHNTLLSVN